MQVAIVSDIHGNRHAFEAVLEDVAAGPAVEVWCLGDVVGYGADPDACTTLARERCRVCLVGNHDLAVLGALDISTFSEAAAKAVEWTRENIAQDSLEFMRGLEPAATQAGMGLFHASPRDPVWEYVLSSEQAEAGMEALEQRVGLIGHSHVALFFLAPEDERPRHPEGAQAEDGAVLPIGKGRWLLNPGSVGQPRDGDPRAAWLELDLDELTAAYHRVEYDIEGAAQAIRDAGLPDTLADRLQVGR